VSYRDGFAETIGPEVCAKVLALVKDEYGCSPLEAIEVMSNVLKYVVENLNAELTREEVNQTILQAVGDAIGLRVAAVVHMQPQTKPKEEPS